jgi:undecaprenyl-diphosphatase
VLRLRPRMARRAAVVAAGIALTALVGLTRVYLGVHYMSDVNAGWALGAAAFSFCAAIALVVSALRSSDGPVRHNWSGAAARVAEDPE